MKALSVFLLSLALIGKDARNVAIGDSITAGYWGSLGAMSYPGRIGAINLGIPGYTSQQVLWYEMRPAADNFYPGSWLLVMAGTNDLLTGVPAPSLESNVSQIVSMGKQIGFKVMVLTIPSIGGKEALYNSWIILGGSGADKVCDITRVVTFGSDGIHPDPAGYARIANVVSGCLGRE